MSTPPTLLTGLLHALPYLGIGGRARGGQMFALIISGARCRGGQMSGGSKCVVHSVFTRSLAVCSRVVSPPFRALWRSGANFIFPPITDSSHSTDARLVLYIPDGVALARRRCSQTDGKPIFTATEPFKRRSKERCATVYGSRRMLVVLRLRSIDVLLHSCTN